MERSLTRGQPGALAAVRSMVVGPAPHAVLLVGPASSGKTTLALDLAAGLLCRDPDPAARPCRDCRGCRLVASGNHPDLHRLAPEGPGRQIRIGAPREPERGTIRHLIGELALLPVEDGPRVAIVEEAHRLNDAAQNALLKILEEPPPGVTIVLCADEEECLLPTVRSRCVRVRLGPAAGREIERWLSELGVAEPPQAARLARLAGGRPGLALAYARSPDAERIRGEIARGLLDMLPAGPKARLAAIRGLMSASAGLESALTAARGEAGEGDATPATPRRRGARAGRGTAAPADGPAPDAGGATEEAAADEAPSGEGAEAPRAASDRRAAAAALLEIWADVARDLAVARLGGGRQLHDPDLLDDLRAAAAGLDAAALPAFMTRLGEVSAQLDDNVSPELALDVLALAWPRPAVAAAPAAPTAHPTAPRR
jgi:DNA polymerase-3 subunit delta'